MNRFIEHTLLKPDASEHDIMRLVEEAIEYNFLGICVPPFWVKKVAREIVHQNIQLVTVVGFPFGYSLTETKLEECRLAVEQGTNEIDVVINLSAFKSSLPWVKIELAKCASFAHGNNNLIKAIIETAYLSDEEIAKACKICAEAGVDFVKTSTGYAKKRSDSQAGTFVKKFIAVQCGCEGFRWNKRSSKSQEDDRVWRRPVGHIFRCGNNEGISRRTSAMTKHLNITVSGRVQGVGFRDFVRRTATDLEVKGTVRNEPDGTVFIEAEGPEDQLKLLLQKCKSGPPLASVRNIVVDEGSVVGHARFAVVQ